jgi:AhpD family alkylhydroperoxidase
MAPVSHEHMSDPLPPRSPPSPLAPPAPTLPATAEPADGTLAAFHTFRERMNREILAEGNLVINRFFALDTRTYESGALDTRTKELLGLVASAVLRCDDCITYHLIRCHELGLTRPELLETLSVALVVGGSIVIPHLRRAVERWGELEGVTGN